MKLRGIIREILEGIVNLHGASFGENLKSKIDYLEEFELKEYKNTSDKEAWKFFLKKGFAVFAVIIIHKPKDTWRFILNIEDDSTKFSPNLGKREFGPFQSLDEFLKEINKTLESHLVLDPQEFDDDREKRKVDIVKDLLKKLKQKEHILRKISSEELNELKEICDFINQKINEDLEKIIEMLSEKTNGIENLILKLQKIDKIEFYEKMEKFF